MIQDVFLEQLLEEYEEVSEHKTEAPGMNPIFQLYLDSLHKTSRFHKVYLDYLPVIPADSILEQLNPLFNFMLEEIRKNSPGSLFFLKGTFARFLRILDTPSLYCIARVQSDSSSQEYIFSKICHIMEASRGRSSREYLEKQLHYNGEYLNRIVKKYTGKTISEYGQDFCLAEAGRLLTKTDMSVSAIITELGYSNRSYFYRIFQNAFNETPLEYRKKHKDTSVS